MAKAKSKSAVKPAQAAAKSVKPAQAATSVASTATKLTKRNTTPLNTVLVATGKPLKLRAAHNQAAWQAVSKALPATAAKLAELKELQVPQCVSPHAYLSYMLHRGYLTAKA